MFEYFEKLAPFEVTNLRKTIQDLFRQTCILKVKYDPVTLEARDNPRYTTCVNHKEFIEDYLAVLGLELFHDPQENIFILSGEGAVVERLSLNTTKMLILLKVIYADKIMGEGLGATVTSLSELRKYGSQTGLIVNKLNNTEWNDALSLFKRHQIIELPKAIGELEDDAPIYMYSTINVLFPTTTVNELLDSFKEMEGGL